MEQTDSWAFLEHALHTVCCEELNVGTNGVVVRVALHWISKVHSVVPDVQRSATRLRQPVPLSNHTGKLSIDRIYLYSGHAISTCKCL